jgi:hypothetical protein
MSSVPLLISVKKKSPLLQRLYYNNGTLPFLWQMRLVAFLLSFLVHLFGTVSYTGGYQQAKATIQGHIAYIVAKAGLGHGKGG